MDCSRGSQWPAIRTDIAVACGVVSEVATGEHAISPFVSFPHRNMRRDLLVQEPSKQLARSVSSIGCKPLRLQAEHHLGSIDHGLGCRHLLIGARWRRLDINDDSVLDRKSVV